MSLISVILSKCLLPSAVTSGQKLFCATAGFGFFGIGTGLTYKFSDNYLTIKNFRRLKNKLQYKTTQTTQTTPPPATPVTIRPPIVNFGINAGASLMFGLCATYSTILICNESRRFCEEIKGTNRCCNIINSAMNVSIKNTFWGCVVVLNIKNAIDFHTKSHEYLTSHLYKKKQN